MGPCSAHKGFEPDCGLCVAGLNALEAECESLRAVAEALAAALRGLARSEHRAQFFPNVRPTALEEEADVALAAYDALVQPGEPAHELDLDLDWLCRGRGARGGA